MKLVILGATGMVGKSVLHEALQNIDIEKILVIGRESSGIEHAKLSEILLKDLFKMNEIEKDLVGYDACIWAIGMSSVGKSEPEYAKVTEELTLLWAKNLLRINPKFSFCYCSANGAGGKSMWARVRQRVETELQQMPFQFSGAVRPAVIQPSQNITSRTRAYRIAIGVMKPLNPIFPYLIRYCPKQFTTSKILALSMIGVVQGKANQFILESKDINQLGQRLLNN
ncbi:hypothetical protein B9T31_12460 [Acinetobacter sp. ANC 4558]|uniref:hypothetical protein n=1 Tax=Acinetobacter sp. ANC 4558 TaxID=1977876 RepID=UPI000A330B7F|nr:hypothetical protein [Acinetobacter sp. ANC 4558]OTG85284.1 hypothetical protein B9T31_12460 [Acinetobacter sp. ANC 4558]